MRALFYLTLLTLSVLTTSSHGHGHHGSVKKALTELANGARLVMENYDGDVIVRPAREAVTDKLPPNASPATVRGNRRVKSNKKSPKAGADAGATRKHGLNKSSPAAGKDPLQAQRHHHSNEHQQQRANKKSGESLKTTENAQTCRYAKSSWTDCDAQTNVRTRTLSLKKGDSHCLPTRTIQKKCKKVCRYEKSAWSECKAGQMTREEKLKPAEDGKPNPGGLLACNPVRISTKKCNPGNGRKTTASGGRSTKTRKHKEKGTTQVAGPQP